MEACDAHCHVHETPAALAALDALGPQTVLCVQATQPGDWGDVLRLRAQRGRQIIPALGLHPWFVADAPATWAAELRALLAQQGGACIVGECGVDKAARSPETGRAFPLEPQAQALRTQLAIAHELGLPVSVHCVRAFGALADALRDAERAQALPPRIMLHSYSGAPDMLRQLFFRGALGQRMYVSFSAAVNGRSRARAAECIRAAPPDRLLVESDLRSAELVAPALDAATALVAEARGWPLPEARRTLAHNAQAFFSAQLAA